MRPSPRVSLVRLAPALLAAACGTPNEARPAAPAPAAPSTPTTTVGTAPAATSAAPGEGTAPREAVAAQGPFRLHEWGLFAVDARAPGFATAATETPAARAAGPADTPRARRVAPVQGLGLEGIGTRGGKPVLYVHLDPGASEARFTLRLGIPAAQVPEHWPMAGALAPSGQGDAFGWQGVVARPGPCTAPQSAPGPLDPACVQVPDGFCEAAELPRYVGGRETCLEVEGQPSDLLFYRASNLPTEPLPLRMVPDGEGWKVEAVGDVEVSGPVYWLTSSEGGDVHLRALSAQQRGQRLREGEGPSLRPEDVRGGLLAEARARGLSDEEADAFVDAWAPAYFDRCRRQGPEASGAPPLAFRPARTSLLYFAPAPVVDAMLPLSTEPPAREQRRVFLVRWVDGRSTL